jgi:hypothetical protein
VRAPYPRRRRPWLTLVSLSAAAYDPGVRKWPVLVVILLAGAGVAIAVLPFDRSLPLPRGSFTYRSSAGPPASCAPPIVSAWRHEPEPSGWFGYAPLTSTPASAYEPCSGAARRRLAYAGLLEVPGVVMVLARRRRFNPPTNPQPNVAT